MSDGISEMMAEQDREMLERALTSPALVKQCRVGRNFDYPLRYKGKVPLKVIVSTDVNHSLSEFKKYLGITDQIKCIKSHEYYVWVDEYGRAFALFPNGEKIFISFCCYEVTAWHEKVLPEDDIMKQMEN